MLHAGDVDGALGLAKTAIGANPSDRVSRHCSSTSSCTGASAQQHNLSTPPSAEDNPDSAMAWTLLGRASTRIDTATEAYQKPLESIPTTLPPGLEWATFTGQQVSSIQGRLRKALELDSGKPLRTQDLALCICNMANVPRHFEPPKRP